jgi:formylmethanofuran dehydrogenase subunit E
MVEAKHEPLISIDILEKIIERKKRKIYYRKETREDIANKMPLRNYLICEDCGKIFSG